MSEVSTVCNPSQSVSVDVPLSLVAVLVGVESRFRVQDPGIAAVSDESDPFHIIGCQLSCILHSVL